jgi:tellurite resistance protein
LGVTVADCLVGICDVPGLVKRGASAYRIKRSSDAAVRFPGVEAMIIFGTRGVTYSAKKGDFHCPGCGGTKPYNHKRVRRFFTLYFIPVIPLDLLGEYVECQGCKETYNEKVLGYDPRAQAKAFEAEYHKAIRRVMVMMMLADGSVEEEEITTIRSVYAEIARRDLSEAEVKIEIDEVLKFGLTITDYVGRLVGNLNDSGKESVIRAAFLVAAADGSFADEERALLAEIGDALQLTPAHLRGLLATLTESGTEEAEARPT